MASSSSGNKQDVLEKEIDLIQSCVNRMAQNSFMVKGWLITLVTVILALLPENVNVRGVCVIVLLATFCFWYLDAFFLRLERLYRWKYEWVISKRAENDKFYYDLNPMNQDMWLLSKACIPKEAPSVVRVMFTKSLTPLYGMIIGVTLFIFINTWLNWI